MTIYSETPEMFETEINPIHIHNIFKRFDVAKDIETQKITELFNYEIGFSKDEVITKFSEVFYITTDNSLSATYYSLQQKYYENQSVEVLGQKRIIPSSKIHTNVGDDSVSSLMAFFFRKSVKKDGIYNSKPRENVVFDCSGIVDGATGSDTYSICYALYDPRATKYILYDEKVDDNEGLMKLKIYQSPSLSSKADLVIGSDFEYRDDMVVGRVFYKDAIVILDSLNNAWEANYTFDGATYKHYVPYPVSNVETPVGIQQYKDDKVIAPIAKDFSNFVFNRMIGTTGGALYDYALYDIDKYTDDESALLGFFISRVAKANESIAINSIKISFVLYKEVRTLNVTLGQDEFNYSLKYANDHGIKNLIPKATEENPIWFNKVGFYDYDNNLLGIGRLSVPIKKTDTREIKLKFKAI